MEKDKDGKWVNEPDFWIFSRNSGKDGKGQREGCRLGIWSGQSRWSFYVIFY